MTATEYVDGWVENGDGTATSAVGRFSKGLPMRPIQLPDDACCVNVAPGPGMAVNINWLDTGGAIWRLTITSDGFDLHWVLCLPVAEEGSQGAAEAARRRRSTGILFLGEADSAARG